MRNQPTFFVLILILLIMFSVATAGAERVPPLPGLFYYQPAAYGDGSEVLWNNPAGLGKFDASGFQLLADLDDRNVARSWGVLLHRRRIGMAYRYLDRPDGPHREYVFGLGVPLMQHGDYIGLSYRHFKDSPGLYRKRTTWNIGILSQRSRRFAWAATLSNFNRAKIKTDSLNGTRSEIEQRYSVAYRPLGDKLTFSVDMMLSTRTRLSNADFVYHVEAVPKPGLIVNGYVDSDKNFEIGVRANLLKYFVGTRSSFDSDGNSRLTTVYLGGTDMRQPSLIRQPRRSLTVALAGRVRENPPQPRFGHGQTPFANIIDQLYRAAQDPSIAEVVLDLKGLSIGLGRAQELREALTFFRSRSKRAICYLTVPGNTNYYIATACDSILIPPVSQLNLVGLRAELTFYAGLFEKAGVKADIVRIGEFKTAPERYTRAAATDENRQQINRILDNTFCQFVEGIARGRGLEPDSVRRIIDCGPYTSEQALTCGLVDGLCYRDETSKLIGSGLPEISFTRYRQDTLLNRSWGRPPEIAVVVAEGEMAFSKGQTFPPASVAATPPEMERALRRVSADPNVKGIIFRINSPGGLALAGDAIMHPVATAAAKKPLVVSMGNLAASGGYYVALPAEWIFANRGTVTGSIGIYGGKPDLSGLYDKIDIGKELYTRGRFAGMLSWTRPFSEEEREKYRSDLQSFYEHFLQLVSDSRRLPVDSVDALGRGRVWTGQEALANGLIDELGGLKQAVEHLATLLHLDDYTVRLYPENRPLFLLPRLPLLGALASLLTGDGGSADGTGAAEGLLPEEGIYTRMPYDLVIE